MNRSLLEALVAARQEKQPAVLVRGLVSGPQFMMTRRETVGDVQGLDPDLLDIARQALEQDGARTVKVGDEAYLFQTLAAPVRLIVVGAVHIAQFLIPMARQLGYEVRLIDPRTAFAKPTRFPAVEIDNRWPDEAMTDLDVDSRTAVVTLSHDPKIDEPALRAALDAGAFYIGALGSRKNHANRVKRLEALGYSADTLARIHGPVGLNLGGRAPAEIAVAILAEVIQSRYQLSER